VKDLRIAAVQMNALLGRRGQNLAVHRRYIERAARAKADLVCFPELSVSGHFCHNDSWKESEPLEGPSVIALTKWAREFNILVSAGIAERVGSVAYNAQVILGPNGVIGRQHKLHPSRDEYFYYRGGSEISIIDIGKAKLGISICYDIMQPEITRIMALWGAEVILFPHAARCGTWKEARKRQTQYIRQNREWVKLVVACRCYDSVAFGVYNNQSGNAAPYRTEPVVVHAGGIAMFNPEGKLIAEGKVRRIGAEEMVVATFKAADREKLFPSAKLQQRRAELFKPLTM
jgi:predicted amidohydrolase